MLRGEAEDGCVRFITVLRRCRLSGCNRGGLRVCLISALNRTRQIERKYIIIPMWETTSATIVLICRTVCSKYTGVIVKGFCCKFSLAES